MPDSTQVLTKEAFLALKHPLQRRRFALALFFALILFPLIGVALVLGTVVLLVPFFAFLLWMGDGFCLRSSWATASLCRS